MRTSLAALNVPCPAFPAIALLSAALLVSACSGATASAPPPSGPEASGPGASPTQAPSVPLATPATSPLPSPSDAPDAGVTGRWEGAGTLQWPRRAPSAVQLGDGRVLVVGEEGGKYEGPPPTSMLTELWDPATGSWTETESLPKERAMFAAVTLDDGRALIAGGVNGQWQSYSSAYLYDPETGRWTKTGLLGTARADPVAAVLPDGHVLVAGGAYWTGVPAEARQGGIVLAAYRPEEPAGGSDDRIRLGDTWPGPSGRALATAELYDPASGTWSPTGAMRFARLGAASTVLADGRVLVVGSDWGEGVADRARLSAEIYDPSSGRFTLVDDLPREPSWADHPTLVALDDGDAVLMGWGARRDEAADDEEGARPPRRTAVFRFEAETGAWTETVWETSYPYGLYAGLPGGLVLAGGGEGTPDPYGGTSLGTRDAALYDTAAGTWTALPPMPGPRLEAEVVVLADGAALVVGGYSDGGDGSPLALGDAFLFRPAR